MGNWRANDEWLIGLHKNSLTYLKISPFRLYREHARKENNKTKCTNIQSKHKGLGESLLKHEERLENCYKHRNWVGDKLDN